MPKNLSNARESAEARLTHRTISDSRYRKRTPRTLQEARKAADARLLHREWRVGDVEDRGLASQKNNIYSEVTRVNTAAAIGGSRSRTAEGQGAGHERHTNTHTAGADARGNPR